MVTDQYTNVIARHDYLPFGDEIPANTAGRGSPWGAPDGVTQRFTGQTRDSETGVDYFNARYFAGALGRFNSPDRFLGSIDLTNPQTFNRYAYALNNPLTFTDPFGLDECDDEDGGDQSSCSNTADSNGTYRCTVFLSCNDIPPIAEQPPGPIIDLPANPPPLGGNPWGENPQDSSFDWLGMFTNFAAGAGDALTFGLTSKVRDLMDTNSVVNKNSSSYSSGSWTGTGLSAAIGTAGALKALGPLSRMEIAVGPGQPFHVAFGTNGAWLHAAGDFFDMTITGQRAAAFARMSWFRSSPPILNPQAVLGTAGATASTCVTGACYAFLKGWGF